MEALVIGRKKMTKIVAGIEYYNAVVPEFNSNGCPDLLGWDEAMHNKLDDERDVWAIFHDKKIAELCRPVMADFFDKHHKDNYDEFTSGEPTFVFETEREEAFGEATLDWFWDDVIGDCFDYDLWADKDGNVLDADGKPFDWDSEGYRKQKPSFKNYLVACERHLAYDFEHAIRPVDCAAEHFVSWLQQDQERLIELGRELYNDLYYQTFGD